EFLAHSANVNCLSIGKKTSGLLITGGDDYKVNLWAIGKPTSLMSLCGHGSEVDSVVFDSAEVLVLAGASSGLIKLWDLEEAKNRVVLLLNFIPFGEFLASGSNDTNLKIWYIRKKGCIQTYKGHTRGIDTIKFSPDGRWVVTGGLDNAVKVWDLTAGKLIHDFKFHEGSIRSLDFHPLEFLLATGGNSNVAQKPGSSSTSNVNATSTGQTGDKSFIVHSDTGKDSSESGRESITFSKTKQGMLLRPAHVRKTPTKQSVAVQSSTPKQSESDGEKTLDTKAVLDSEESGRKPFDAIDSIIKSITSKFEKALFPESPTDEAKSMLLKPPRVQRSPNTKYNETRWAVSVDSENVDSNQSSLEKSRDTVLEEEFADDRGCNPSEEDANDKIILSKPEQVLSPEKAGDEQKSKSIPARVMPVVLGRDENMTTGALSVTLTRPDRTTPANLTSDESCVSSTRQARSSPPPVMPVVLNQTTKMESDDPPATSARPDRSAAANLASDDSPVTSTRQARTSPAPVTPLILNRSRSTNMKPDETHVITRRPLRSSSARARPVMHNQTTNTHDERPVQSTRSARTSLARVIPMKLNQADDVPSYEPPVALTRSARNSPIVRHFWERGDIKGAIMALKKLSDHSVQADVISILTDKTDILTLDLFSQLAPVLTGLLGSTTERPVSVSLEMLLKLVAVFGTVVQSTVSARRSVGVDIHAEERLQICQSCSAELQKIQKILPPLTRASGSDSRPLRITFKQCPLHDVSNLYVIKNCLHVPFGDLASVALKIRREVAVSCGRFCDRIALPGEILHPNQYML
uniref:Katanin p80 subunit C-terminal domain-containing protein n=1 Tax=Brassica oleracea var. oleracea TaxID=109376 RepID=A0A0D3BVD0_BRAOL